MLIRVSKKRLSKVDLPALGSHQHEIGVPARARQIFEPDQIGPVDIQFAIIKKDGSLVERQLPAFYYDVREGKPRSSEYRLYYPPSLNTDLLALQPGDFCGFLRTIDHDIQLVLCSQEAPQYQDVAGSFDSLLSGEQPLLPGMQALSDLFKHLMSAKLFRVIDLEKYSPLKPEEMGSKDKTWLVSKNSPDRSYLFKRSKRFRGEIWAEKLAFEIATIMGIPAARIDIGWDRTRDEFGSIARSFTDRRLEVPPNKYHKFPGFSQPQLVHGNEIMTLYIGSQYPTHGMTRTNEAYTLKNISSALQAFGCQHLWPGLLKYFYLDCLIGNMDRHHENWGVLIYKTKKEDPKEVRYLAPTYDHGPSFHSGGEDKHQQGILDGRSVARFYENGRSVIHRDDGKRASFPELLEDLIAIEQKKEDLSVAANILKGLERLSDDLLEEIVAAIPDSLMTRTNKDFATAYVRNSREHIRTRLRDAL